MYEPTFIELQIVDGEMRANCSFGSTKLLVSEATRIGLIEKAKKQRSDDVSYSLSSEVLYFLAGANAGGVVYDVVKTLVLKVKDRIEQTPGTEVSVKEGTGDEETIRISWTTDAERQVIQTLPKPVLSDADMQLRMQELAEENEALFALLTNQRQKPPPRVSKFEWLEERLSEQDGPPED